jgi:fatty acid desaturase
MTTSPIQPDQAELDASTAQQLQQWTRGLRLLLTVLPSLFAYLAVRMLIKGPQFERIFEDMLGSRDKLPKITQLIIDHHFLLTACVLMLNFIGFGFIWNLRRGNSVCLIACCLIVADFIIIELTFNGLLAPLTAILQGLSSAP